MAYYLDTSAVAKLVVHEPGSVELRRWVDEATDPLVTSDLTRTELLRAVRRARPQAAQRARAVLDSLVVLRLSAGIF